LLAITRHNRRLGRGADGVKGADPTQADERVTLLMAYLIAREAGERDTFSESEMKEFGTLLPKLKRADGAKRAVEFNDQVLKRRGFKR
jgi:hypothetical protein